MKFWSFFYGCWKTKSLQRKPLLWFIKDSILCTRRGMSGSNDNVSINYAAYSHVLRGNTNPKCKYCRALKRFQRIQVSVVQVSYKLVWDDIVLLKHRDVFWTILIDIRNTLLTWFLYIFGFSNNIFRYNSY